MNIVLLNPNYMKTAKRKKGGKGGIKYFHSFIDPVIASHIDNSVAGSERLLLTVKPTRKDGGLKTAEIEFSSRGELEKFKENIERLLARILPIPEIKKEKEEVEVREEQNKKSTFLRLKAKIKTVILKAFYWFARP